MKKNPSALLAIAFIIMGNSCIAQTSMQFKGKDIVVAGVSAGSVKGIKNNPSFYECFWELNKENKTLTVTTVQTFGTNTNNKDIEVKTVSVADLALEFITGDIASEDEVFGEPVYILNLYTIENKELVKTAHCYRFSETEELEAGENTWSLRIVFKEKTEAQSFIGLLKGIKL